MQNRNRLPLSAPIVGADGRISREWLRYFDSLTLAESQLPATPQPPQRPDSVSVETESREEDYLIHITVSPEASGLIYYGEYVELDESESPVGNWLPLFVSFSHSFIVGPLVYGSLPETIRIRVATISASLEMSEWRESDTIVTPQQPPPPPPSALDCQVLFKGDQYGFLSQVTLPEDVGNTTKYVVQVRFYSHPNCSSEHAISGWITLGECYPSDPTLESGYWELGSSEQWVRARCWAENKNGGRSQAVESSSTMYLPNEPPPGSVIMPDVSPHSEVVVDLITNYCFSGQIVFHTSAEGYDAMAGVEVNFYGPLDESGNPTSDTTNHIMGVVDAPEPGQGDVNVSWTSDAWPRPPVTDRYRVRYTKIGKNGERQRNNPRESALLVVQTLNEAYPVPSVPVFWAGRLTENGEFLSEMYWDTDRLDWMLVDWMAYAPSAANWSGISIIIETPDGIQHDATGFIPGNQFAGLTNGPRWIRRTIAVEPKNVPDPPQQWKFICVSHGLDGQPVRDQYGKLSGPSVLLSTLVAQLAEQVTGFTAIKVRGKNDQKGNETWYLEGQYTRPDDGLWEAVEVRLKWDDEDKEITLGRFSPEPGSSVGTWRTSSWPVGRAARYGSVRAYSVGRNGRINTNSPPSVTIAVSPSVGQPGQEYAPLVTSYSAYRQPPAYADTQNFTDQGGGEMFGFAGSWQGPSSDDFAGVRVYARDPGGGLHDLTGFLAGQSGTFRTDQWPLADGHVGNWTIYFVSCRGAGLENSIQDGGSGTQTPKVVVSVARTSSPKLRGDRVEDLPWESLELDVRPIRRVSSLPSVSDPLYPDGTIVYLTTESRLYRKSGSQWIQAVQGTDIGPYSITTNHLTANCVTFGKVAAHAVGTSQLVAYEIMVGPGGDKPPMFGIYNANGDRIGFIGQYLGYDGGWFKQLRVGGTLASPKLYCDPNGNLFMAMGSGDTILEVQEQSGVPPFRLRHATDDAAKLCMEARTAMGNAYARVYFGNDDANYAEMVLQYYRSTNYPSYRGGSLSISVPDPSDPYYGTRNSIQLLAYESAALIELRRMGNEYKWFSVAVNASSPLLSINNIGVQVDQMTGATGDDGGNRVYTLLDQVTYQPITFVTSVDFQSQTYTTQTVYVAVAHSGKSVKLRRGFMVLP